MTTIKVPQALLSNCLKLKSDDFFAALVLALAKGNERAARTQIASKLGGGASTFRRGRDSLIAQNLIDADGNMGMMWMRMVTQKHAKHGRFGVPSPFERIPTAPIGLMLSKKMSKTALMLLVGTLGKMEIHTSGDGNCNFCGVARRTVRFAKAELMEAGLWQTPKEDTVDAAVFQGGADEIDELVADVQESLTHELAVREGVGAYQSGLYGSIKNALPSSYLGFLSQKSPAIAQLLTGMKQEESIVEVGGVPRAYLRGFEEGWNAERVLRGYEPEIFAG